MVFGLSNPFAKREPQYPEVRVPDSDQMLHALEGTIKPSGYNGVDAFKTFAPLSLDVDRYLRPTHADAPKKAIAKNVARAAFHIFVTSWTVLFQAAYGLYKRAESEYSCGSHAKRILNLIQTVGYSPGYIKHVQDKAGVNVVIAANDRKGFMKRIRELANWDETIESGIQKEAAAIAEKLLAMHPDERPKAFDRIIKAFIGHRGFDDVPREERIKLAKTMARGVLEKIASDDAEAIVDDLADNHQIIGLNERLHNLAGLLRNAFGLSKDEADGVVAEVMRNAIIKKHGSKEAFNKVVLGKHKEHIDAIFSAERGRLEVLIHNLEIRYFELSALLEQARIDSKKLNAANTADQIRAIIKNDLERLSRELKSVNAELKAANNDKEVVEKGGIRRGVKGGFAEIEKSKAELTSEIDYLTRKSDDITKMIVHSNDLLRRVNRGEVVNLKEEEMKRLQVEAAEVHEYIGENKDRLANLANTNDRELKAFLAIMDVIHKEGALVEQGAALDAVAKQVADQANQFDSTTDKVCKALGRKAKVRHLTRFDVIRETFTSFGPDSIAARNAFGELNRSLEEHQRAYLAQEVAKQAGIEKGYTESLSGAAANFGKRYIQAYVTGESPSVDGVFVDPNVIHKVMNSEAAKKIAEHWTILPGSKGLRKFMWRNFTAPAA
ncbi:MAG: hypothetical protein S4CHLAM37_14610 [Chlamydiia bacterium]|nr:hypothetical protein [Chlamydiia bacterium]